VKCIVLSTHGSYSASRLKIIRLPILAKFYLSIDGEQQRECERAALPDSMEIQLGDPDADQLCDATVQHALVFARC
jgi:hypothetical protein